MNKANKWTYVKASAAHLFGDYGAQTSHMAMCKGTNARVRTQHAGCIAASFAAAMATDQTLSTRQKATVIAINAGSHWLIDSCQLSKVIDQALHIAIALLSVLCVSWRGHGTKAVQL